MKTIHFDCLKEWLHSKIHFKESTYIYSYNWKFLECELCKERFKDSYLHKGRKYQILNYHRPTDGDFIIFESFTNTPHKTIHVLVVPKGEKERDKVFYVGWGNDVDMRITDISVSRLHATIWYSKGKWYVWDEDAKFGTLMNFKEPIGIPCNESFFLSI